MLFENPTDDEIRKQMNFTGQNYLQAKELLLRERHGEPPEGYSLWEHYFEDVKA